MAGPSRRPVQEPQRVTGGSDLRDGQRLEAAALRRCAGNRAGRGERFGGSTCPVLESLLDHGQRLVREGVHPSVAEQSQQLWRDGVVRESTTVARSTPGSSAHGGFVAVVLSSPERGGDVQGSRDALTPLGTSKTPSSGAATAAASVPEPACRRAAGDVWVNTLR
jgi:hypothetical protein